MVQEVRRAEAMLGTVRFGAGVAEEGSAIFRRSLYVVEDVPAEAEIAGWQLKSAGFTCTWRRVERESEFRDALRDWRPTSK